MSMKSPPPRPSHLRATAETRLAQSLTSGVTGRSDKELVHELQVHQIELEMQNAALVEAQIALEKSRDRFADFYECAPVGYLTITDKGLISDINLTGAVLLGVDRKQLRLKPFARFVKPADADRYRSHFFGALKTDEKLTCELALLRGDGSHVDVRLDSLRLIKDDQTPVLRVVLTDISGQVALQAELEQYRKFFRLSTDPMCIADPFGCFKEVNPAFVQLTGFTEDELIAKPFLDLVLPEDRQKTADEMKLQVSVRPSMDFVNRYVCKNGAVILFAWTAYFDATDGVTYATARDVTERKRATEALARVGDKYAALLRSSSDGIHVLDVNGNVVEASDSFCRMLGYTREEMLSMNVSQWDSTISQGKFKERLEQLASASVTVETKHRHRDGHVIDVEISATGIVIDGELLAYASTRDITERKQQEGKLKHLQRLLLETGRIGHVGGWEFYIDTRQLTWTEEVYRIHEAELDYELSIEKGINFYAPSSRPIIEQAVRKAIELGEPYDLELELITAKGTRRNVHTIGMRDSELGRVLGFFQDITERKRIEERLRRYQDHLEEIVQQRTAELDTANNEIRQNAERLSAMLVLSQKAAGLDERQLWQLGVDEATRLTESKIGYLHFVNEDQETIQLGTWSTQTPAQCSAAYDSHYPVSAAGVWADSVRLGYTVIHNDYQALAERKGYPEGHAHVIRHMGVPVIDGGKVRMIIGVGNRQTDYEESHAAQLELIGNDLWLIVTRRHAELALAEARDAAEAGNRAKTIFLANMSHELRTPMNGVMGMIDLVLMRATDPKQIDWLNKSKGAAQRMVNVINDIIDFSKAEADRLPLEEKNFSLSQIIDDAIAMHDITAQGKGLNLTHEIPATFPDQLSGDAFRLRQILLNFLGNACKFSKQGTITVRVNAIEQDGDSVLARIEVEDQGIGISPEQQATLFQAFAQVDGSMTRKHGGSGLGLIISKRLANLMGGDAGVVSQEGKGTTFWATVRLKPAKDCEVGI